MNEYSIAPIYDALLFPFIRAVRKAVLRICVEQRYESILDVCCGTGDQLKMLRKHGFQVSGVDLSDEMLEVSARGAHAPVCRKEDASAMSYPDDSFELTTTTFALHEKDRPTARAIVEEMVRVTKPDGDLLFVDYRFDEQSSPFSMAIIRMIERIAGGEHYRNFLAYIERGGLDSLLAGLPLTQVRETRLGMGSVIIARYRFNY
jgi:demethylmenaquinone methyltransferase/2-methoxy-6-polyprenyl-1,4-benzoquinol methylase